MNFSLSQSQDKPLAKIKIPSYNKAIIQTKPYLLKQYPKTVRHLSSSPSSSSPSSSSSPFIYFLPSKNPIKPYYHNSISPDKQNNQPAIPERDIQNLASPFANNINKLNYSHKIQDQNQPIRSASNNILAHRQFNPYNPRKSSLSQRFANFSKGIAKQNQLQSAISVSNSLIQPSNTSNLLDTSGLPLPYPINKRDKTNSFVELNQSCEQPSTEIQTSRILNRSLNQSNTTKAQKKQKQNILSMIDNSANNITSSQLDYSNSQEIVGIKPKSRQVSQYKIKLLRAAIFSWSDKIEHKKSLQMIFNSLVDFDTICQRALISKDILLQDVLNTAQLPGQQSLKLITEEDQIAQNDRQQDKNINAVENLLSNIKKFLGKTKRKIGKIVNTDKIISHQFQDYITKLQQGKERSNNKVRQTSSNKTSTKANNSISIKLSKQIQNLRIKLEQAKQENIRLQSA